LLRGTFYLILFEKAPVKRQVDKNNSNIHEQPWNRMVSKEEDIY